MRILLLANLWHNAFLGLGVGLARGLRQLGHSVQWVHVPEAMHGVPWPMAEIEDLKPELGILFTNAFLPTSVLLTRRVQSEGGKIVSVCFDDPYDLATGLRAAAFSDLTLTAEKNALPVYRAAGHKAEWIEGWIDEGLFRPLFGDLHLPAMVDLVFVGMPIMPPRPSILPLLQDGTRQKGKTFRLIDGIPNWIQGTDLAHVLHTTRLALEIPRTEFTKGNLDMVACSYPSPRVHLYAACGVYQAFVTIPRPPTAPDGPDPRIAVLAQCYPDILVLPFDADAIISHLDEMREEERRERAESNYLRFKHGFTGLHAARSLLASAEKHGLLPSGKVPDSPGSALELLNSPFPAPAIKN